MENPVVPAVQTASAEPAAPATAIETPVTPAENAAPATATETPAPEPEATPANAGDTGAAPAEEPKVSLAEHIKLRKRAQEAEQQAAYLRGQLDGVKPQAEQAPKPQGPEFIPLEEFKGSFEEWVVAKTKFELKQEQEQQQKATQAANIQQSFDARCNAAAKEIPDLQETINAARLPQYADSIVLAVKKSDLGPQIVYYLAQNQAEAARLAQMEPELAIMELGSLREKVKASLQPKTNRVTQAPPPIKPPVGTGVSIDTDPMNMPMADYAKYRQQQFAKVGGKLVAR